MKGEKKKTAAAAAAASSSILNASKNDIAGPPLNAMPASGDDFEKDPASSRLLLSPRRDQDFYALYSANPSSEKVPALELPIIISWEFERLKCHELLHALKLPVLSNAVKQATEYKTSVLVLYQAGSAYELPLLLKRAKQAHWKIQRRSIDFPKALDIAELVYEKLQQNGDEVWFYDDLPQTKV
ncbi:hypothetical protein RJZ56_003721 [Blastomyces dermatitidis]